MKITVMETLLKKCLITGDIANTGLGFSCYKKASELSVNGELEYKSSTKAILILSGKVKEVESFIRWLKKSPGISLIDTSDIDQSKKTVHRFYNQEYTINQLS